MGSQIEEDKEFLENIKVSKCLNLIELETYFFEENKLSDIVINSYSRTNFNGLREEVSGVSKDRLRFLKFIRLDSMVLMTIKDGDKNESVWFEAEFFKEVKSWLPSFEEFQNRMFLMNMIARANMAQ